MSEILEITMLLCFGSSWPISVIKSWKARTTKGKSPAFLCLILLGYASGIASKFLNPAYMASFSEKWYVLFFYVLNFCMISLDFCVYFRNRNLERLAESK